MSICINNNDIESKLIEQPEKKRRGRPKKELSDEDKEKRKELIKQYNKEYREQNKHKISNYDSIKYNNNNNSERIKKHMKRYNNIINILKFLYFNNIIKLGDSDKENDLKLLLDQCKHN